MSSAGKLSEVVEPSSVPLKDKLAEAEARCDRCVDGVTTLFEHVEANLTREFFRAHDHSGATILRKIAILIIDNRCIGCGHGGECSLSLDPVDPQACKTKGHNDPRKNCFGGNRCKWHEQVLIREVLFGGRFAKSAQKKVREANTTTHPAGKRLRYTLRTFTRMRCHAL